MTYNIALLCCPRPCSTAPSYGGITGKISKMSLSAFARSEKGIDVPGEGDTGLGRMRRLSVGKAMELVGMT